MSEFRVRMDPLNPGQFFACCGLLELLDLEKPGVLSKFAFDSTRPRVAEFVISENVDLKRMISALQAAKPEFPDEQIDPKVRPAVLEYRGGRLMLDWWFDEFRDNTLPLKCWAGQVTTKKLLSDLLPLLDPNVTAEDLFEHRKPSSSKFGFDPRSAWDALDVGFSPDKHERAVDTFPAVEVLAAIGLQGFRPSLRRRNGLAYSQWEESLPTAVAQVAFMAPWPGLKCFSYRSERRPRGSAGYFTLAVQTERKEQEWT